MKVYVSAFLLHNMYIISVSFEWYLLFKIKNEIYKIISHLFKKINTKMNNAHKKYILPVQKWVVKNYGNNTANKFLLLGLELSLVILLNLTIVILNWSM